MLDQLGVPYGFTYGLVLTAVSTLTTVAFLFFVDRDRIISGAHQRKDVGRVRVEALAPTVD